MYYDVGDIILNKIDGEQYRVSYVHPTDNLIDVESLEDGVKGTLFRGYENIVPTDPIRLIQWKKSFGERWWIEHKSRYDRVVVTTHFNKKLLSTTDYYLQRHYAPIGQHRQWQPLSWVVSHYAYAFDPTDILKAKRREKTEWKPGDMEPLSTIRPDPKFQEWEP